MAPIAVTFDDDTTSTIESARRRLADLSDYQIPRLRDCPGPLPTQQTLWAELREDIDTFARYVQDLDILVDDQRGERNKKALRAVVDELSQSLEDVRIQSRAALLTSKKTIDSQTASQRDELLRSSAVTEKRSANEKTTEDMLMKKNEDLTSALQRTVDAMQNELSRSVLSTQMLESSTQTLRSTSQTHDLLTTGLDTSKRLITALEKSDWLDRLIICTGLACFFLTVLFILKQRVFDKGMRLAFWWTKWIPDFGGDEALLKAEEGSGTVSQVLATASSIVSSVTGSLSTWQPDATDVSSVADKISSTLSDLTSTSVAADASARSNDEL